MSTVDGGGRPSFTITIGGVKVQMPVKPYPSQVSMMDKVIRGCQKQQNCLLESPTGSGKTLALLCSALAWQRAEKERLEKLSEEEFQQKIIEWQQKEQQKKQQLEKKQKKQKTPEKKHSETEVLPVKSKGWSSSAITISDDEDSEEEMAIFKQPGKKRKMNTKHSVPNSTCDSTLNSLNDSILTNDSSLITEDEDDNEPPQIEDKTPKKSRPVVPVIYFCTRTHKQIEQVVKELQRTSYNNAKSCILASREHTCIADTNIYYPLISYKSKTELCRDLLDPRARRRNALKMKRDRLDVCSFYDNGGVKIGSYSQLAKFNVPSVWDIEDIVKLGMLKNSCPYYGTRLLLKTADIVFCPYNYIIDPVIRSTMNVQLKGHVIIVDEAHNIEDQCRDAASLKLDQTNLNLAKMDCEKLSKIGVNSTSYAALARYMSDISKWIDQKSAEIKSFDDYDRGVISWSGAYTIASFDEFGIGLKAFEKFKENCETALADKFDEVGPDEKETTDIKTADGKNEQEEKNIDENDLETLKLTPDNLSSDSTITNATKTILTSICTVLSLFFDGQYIHDYHVSLVKLMEMKKFEHGKPPQTADGWIDGAQPHPEAATRAVWNNTLSFLCLNPAAVFRELRSAARCVVLTSGTLSPMASFQSELGTEFPIALEANHVIAPAQCWVSTVGRGPAGVDLNGQYRNVGTYAFQDEMGEVLRRVCETVPYGVLCFMPSYVLMDKLHDRWRDTGLLRRLDRVKAVLREPRRGDQLEQLMARYYKAVAQAVRADAARGGGGGGGGRSGALFLAVYRGKISEGLDFSDDNARAVVAIGIPFPNYKEVTVTHKKDYNDKHHQNKGLLPGWEWYQIQAYRALNQALGRCIRHKNDWGAILLVDSRYQQAKNLCGLSKWIRGRVEHSNSWEATVTKLKNFVESRQQD